MDKKDVELAIERFRRGERPYTYRRPVWHLITDSGDYYPLKYIYAMARGLKNLNAHTGQAKKELPLLGYRIVERDGAQGGEVSYWWVNHKQTYQDEHAGGYIWSPKTKRGNVFNQAYLNLTLVKVGDLIVSFALGQVKALGIVSGPHREAAKPKTHEGAAKYWNEIGWMVPIEWIMLESPISPKLHIKDLADLLPNKYSPLQKNGNGHQGCYLASISSALGEKIISLLSAVDAQAFADRRLRAQLQIEQRPAEQRLPVESLRLVTAEHIWNAIRTILEGGKDETYKPSTDYDLLVGDGIRLPPKQVFGLAASEALGFIVKPGHFTAGVDTVCFKLLKDAGYQILPKDSEVEPVESPVNFEERVWAEGRPALVHHLRRERATGLAKAKKAQFFRKYGKLFCEECQMDPSEIYGDIGDACIEVHHHAVHVAEMSIEHKTTLDDLRCLCANCHRIEHRRLRTQAHEQTQ